MAIDCGLSLDLFKEMETTILWELLKRLKLSVDERASLAVAVIKMLHSLVLMYLYILQMSAQIPYHIFCNSYVVQARKQVDVV